MPDCDRIFSCVDCGVRSCRFSDGKYPAFCLTKGCDDDTLRRAEALLAEPFNRKLAVAAAEVEYEGYGKTTRVEEVMLFARKIGAQKIGIATCGGLLKEASVLAKILRAHSFEVYGVMCKVGAQKKVSIGIPAACEAVGQNMCNPILQAMILNREKTDLNLVVGLCVGHDSLFYRYSEAPCTTVVTKDRLLGHNPVAALYTAEGYYKKLLEPEESPHE